MATSPDTAGFFTLIQPATGWRCLFTLPKPPHKYPQHYWFKDVGKMVEAMHRLDAEGFAVYHGNASFRSQSRTQAEVEAVKSLWLDIDCGPNKRYSDETVAWQALQQFLAHTGLPQPFVVASGGGMHVYWPLAEAVTAPVWLGAAKTLKALCVQHGLDADPTATTDLARILRPAGTHNRKLFDAWGKVVNTYGGEPRPVVAGPVNGPYDIVTLQILFGGRTDFTIGVQNPSPSATNTFSALSGPVPDYARLRPGVEAPTLPIAEVTSEPSNPDQIAQQCAQVRALPDARGGLPEPLWYAVLGVLAHCGDAGTDAAHLWSSGDTRYTADDTARKLDQAEAAAGPTTCARFEALNPGPCSTCQFRGKITSPIQLGRQIPAATTAPAPAVDALPLLPFPYQWYGMKLGLPRKPTEDDPSTKTIIAEYAVYIARLQEGERSRTISAVFRSWEPMQGTWRDFVLPLGQAVGERAGSHLAEHGVALRKKSLDPFRTFCVSMTNHYRGTTRYGTRYEQFGWKGTAEAPAFVVGEEVLRPGAAPERIHGSGEVARRGALMQPQGTLEAWTTAARDAFARPGMEAHAFVVACGFAATLYKFTRAQGGAIVHAATIGTGTGKTFALDAAASAWGEVPAVRIKKKDTEVAKFIAIGTLGNLPVTYDELRDTRGTEGVESIKDFVLHYTLGEDKARGNADGGLRSDNLPWSNLMLTAANISLVDTCMADGAETAQASRIFEFAPVLPASLKTTAGDAMMRTMQDNRGHAGRAFVQHVLENYAEVEAGVPSAIATWETRLDAGPEQRHIVRLLGVVTMTLTILRRTGILPLDVEAVSRWAEGIARENAQRVATERTPQPDIVVSRMINDLYPGTLVMPGAKGMPAHEPQGPLVGRFQQDIGEVLFDAKAVRKWMQENNYPMTQILGALTASGIARKGDKSFWSRRTLGAGWAKATGQIWCLAIDGRHPAVAEALGAPAPDNVVALRR